MPYKSHSQPFVPRFVTAAALGLVALVSVPYAIRGGTAASNYMDRATITVVCNSTGGLVGYNYCNWQEPSSNAGSGSQILAIYYSVGNTPDGTFNLDGTIGASATASGSTAITPFTNVTASTGAYLEYIAGSVSGSLLIAEGDYLRLITLDDPGSNATGAMTIEYINRVAHN